MKILAFRSPIDVSRVSATPVMRVRVGAKMSTSPTSPDPTKPTAPPTTGAPAGGMSLKAMQAAQTVGGDAFAVEVSVATAAGGIVGLFFGGWAWGAIGAIGSNLLGRFGANQLCKSGKAGDGKCPATTPPK